MNTFDMNGIPLEKGDKVVISFKTGFLYEARIANIDKDSIYLHAVKRPLYRRDLENFYAYRANAKIKRNQSRGRLLRIYDQ